MKSLTALHSHLSKIHNCSQQEFYHSFFPRYDLYTKDLIKYKDYKQYHSSDFNDRESFADWLADNYKEERTKEYCLQKLRERMTRKLITRLPSHVSLKSILLPSIHGFNRMYGGLEKFVQAMSLSNIQLQFDYLTEPKLHSGEMKIFQDTREQMPLSFTNSSIMKLTVGDYTPDGEFYSDVYVDRKSLADLAGTLSAGRERLEKEIQRAKDLGFYLVFVIEDLYSEALNYSTNTSFSKKLNGQHLFFVIRDLLDKYDNIQMVFSGNRKRAAAVIENVFRLKDQAKTLDLEYLKDLNII